MKNRLFLLCIMALISVCAFAQEAVVDVDVNVNANENSATSTYSSDDESMSDDDGVGTNEVLLDFSKLSVEGSTKDDLKLHESTTLELGKYSTFALTDEESKKLDASLSINEWRVDLNSSASTVVTEGKSYAKQVKLAGDDDAYQGEYEELGISAGDNVLGIKVYFPKDLRYASATIKPPFEIPTYYKNDSGESVFLNNGAIDNVKYIKDISVIVCGRGFGHTLELVLRNADYEEKTVKLGALDFVGWRKLTWNNYYYIDRVENRPLDDQPIYPSISKSWKVVGIRIVKDILTDGGDFVGYIKSFDITYDKNKVDYKGLTIDDEAEWGIEQEYADIINDHNNKKISQQRTLEYLEQIRMQ